MKKMLRDFALQSSDAYRGINTTGGQFIGQVAYEFDEDELDSDTLAQILEDDFGITPDLALRDYEDFLEGKTNVFEYESFDNDYGEPTPCYIVFLSESEIIKEITDRYNEELKNVRQEFSSAERIG